MVMRALGLLLLAAVGLLGQARTTSGAEQAAGSPEERLANVKLFAFGGVGFAGSRSAGEKEYGEVMSRPDRLEILERVFETGTPEAKSYALVGIYNLSRERFAALVSSVQDSKLQLFTAQGCILGKTTLGALVRRIQAGEFKHYV